MKKIAIVVGTAREGNFSQKVAKVVDNHLKEKGVGVTYVDIKDFTFGRTVYIDDDKDLVSPWKDIIDKVEGVIFVCPEYNHTYPGELKILVDSMKDEYSGKTAGIVSVASGKYAGVRMADNLQSLLHTVGFKVAHKTIKVAKVKKEINKEEIEESLDKMVEEM